MAIWVFIQSSPYFNRIGRRWRREMWNTYLCRILAFFSYSFHFARYVHMHFFSLTSYLSLSFALVFRSFSFVHSLRFTQFYFSLALSSTHVRSLSSLCLPPTPEVHQNPTNIPYRTYFHGMAVFFIPINVSRLKSLSIEMTSNCSASASNSGRSNCGTYFTQMSTDRSVYDSIEDRFPVIAVAAGASGKWKMKKLSDYTVCIMSKSGENRYSLLVGKRCLAQRMAIGFFESTIPCHILVVRLINSDKVINGCGRFSQIAGSAKKDSIEQINLMDWNGNINHVGHCMLHTHRCGISIISKLRDIETILFSYRIYSVVDNELLRMDK